MEKRHLIAIE